jgi:hypothetical protein
MSDEKNREKRLAQMRPGIEELELWLADAVRQGLEQSIPTLDRFAARMVDAKLSGIARRVRGWKKMLQEDGAQEKLLGEMASLFLLTRAFRKADELPEGLLQDVFQVAGLTFRKEEILQGEPVEDIWTVAGLTEGAEENLRFRRAWLRGLRTERYALLLDFAWGEQPFAQHWSQGMQFQGAVVYYPSAFPQRALIKDFEMIEGEAWLWQGLDALDELRAQYAQALALQPWTQRLPALLENVQAFFDEKKRWLLRDASRRYLPLASDDAASRALTGDAPLRIFGEWDGGAFLPLHSDRMT